MLLLIIIFLGSIDIYYIHFILKKRSIFFCMSHAVQWSDADLVLLPGLVKYSGTW